MTTTSTISPTTGGRSLITTLREIASDIKIAHSVFALPFVVLASFMAAAMPVPYESTGEGIRLGFSVYPAGHDWEYDWPRFGGQIGLIVLAMVFARTVAMLANRLIDRSLDAENPRTAARALPSGRLTVRNVKVSIALCAMLFMLVCAAFGWLYGNWLPVFLGLPVLAWISAYASFKRFTALCHLYLGSSLALSPLAAAIAIDPSALTWQPALWLIAGMVFCWVAGFDIIYALQDVQVDREQGLFSLPARLGERRALLLSRGLHGLAVACLAGAWLVDDRFSVLFVIGVVIVAAALVWEHATVARWGTTKIALAFFTLNGVISIVLGVLGSIDVVVSG